MPKGVILIVDDEVNIVKSLKRLLADLDFKILAAESGESGLKVFEQEEIHLVISDYRMPGMNGVDFLKAVREKYPDTIRMILSGYADAMAIVEAINDGQVYRFLTKPWNDQEITSTILRAMEQYNLLKENAALNAELTRRNKELSELTQRLEERVEERTRDLEFKNRALMIAHKILDLLPVGVIGVDSEEMVVYLNSALSKHIKSGNIAIGGNARGSIPEPFLERMIEATKTGEKSFFELDDDTAAICVPLPDGVGVIGMLLYSEAHKYAEMAPQEA
jgi:two-component system NtrC family sensor kinase